MLEYNAQYAGYIFGNAWGAVSASAHCNAAKARKLAGKGQYRLKNVDTQIAKFCEEARVEAEEQNLLFGTDATGGGTSTSASPPIYGPPQLPPISPPSVPTDEGGIGIGIPIAIIAVLGIGGAAGIYFMTKKPKSKKAKKRA
jgi:hypothetical protein